MAQADRRQRPKYQCYGKRAPPHRQRNGKALRQGFEYRLAAVAGIKAVNFMTIKTF